MEPFRRRAHISRLRRVSDRSAQNLEVYVARGTSDAAIEADRAPVLQCQAGETDAFRVIVERYTNVLYGTALLMLGNRAEAEDAVQEALVSGWAGISGFDPDRPLRPWLLRILVNHVLQRRRRRFLRVVPLPEARLLPIPSLESSPERSAEAAEDRRELRASLETLPPDAARVIILRFFAELSLTEIAEVLDLPVGTVKSRLHRALERLRAELVPGRAVASSGSSRSGAHEDMEVEA